MKGGSMRWRESAAITMACWCVIAGFVLANALVPGVFLLAFVCPPVFGFVSGLLRPKLPALPLLFVGSVVLAGAGLIMAMLAIGPPDDPHGEGGEVLAGILSLIVGSTVVLLFTTILGAFIRGPFERE